MKKVVFILSILLSVAVSCKEGSKESEGKASGKMEAGADGTLAVVSFTSDRAEAVFTQYLQLRTSLVASEGKDAQKAAGALAEILGEDQGEVKSIALTLASTDKLEEQRILFSDLTTSLDPVFRAAIVEGEIYHQFCPMAFEGKGGFWLSEKEGIRNPYYGDKMLACGKVTEVIRR